MNTNDHELTLADLNFDPPALPEERLREIARSCFGIEAGFSRWMVSGIRTAG